MTNKEKLAIVKKAKKYYIKEESDFICNCIYLAIEDIFGISSLNVFKYIPELKKYKPAYFNNDKSRGRPALGSPWFDWDNRKPRMEIFNALIKELK